jgi:hypothetical protein
VLIEDMSFLAKLDLSIGPAHGNVEAARATMALDRHRVDASC